MCGPGLRWFSTPSLLNSQGARDRLIVSNSFWRDRLIVSNSKLIAFDFFLYQSDLCSVWFELRPFYSHHCNASTSCWSIFLPQQNLQRNGEVFLAYFSKRSVRSGRVYCHRWLQNMPWLPLWNVKRMWLQDKITEYEYSCVANCLPL